MPRTFRELAPRYDALRPLRPEDRARLEATLAGMVIGPDDVVVEVGCGTGRLTLPLRAMTSGRVVGVDTEPGMLAVARQKDPAGRIAWILGSAYRLPIAGGSATLVLMGMLVHLLKQRRRAFREAWRVLRPGGRLSIWTFTPEHVRDFYLNEFFPSVARIDAARFKAPDTLERELRSAGFSAVASERQRTAGELRLSEVVDRVRGKYISTLSLVPPAEYRQGLRRLEELLATDPDRALPYQLEWAILLATR